MALEAGLDPELKSLLGKLLGRRPEDRYSDLKSFIRDLSDYFKKLPEGMGDREALGDYLKGLKIGRLKDVSTAKVMAEQWVPEATAQILEETGRIVTLAEEEPSRRFRPWVWGPGILAVIGAASILGWMAMNNTTKEVASQNPPVKEVLTTAKPTVGSLQVNVEPGDALLKIRYGDVTLSRPAPAVLSDIPLNTPIEINASKKGFQTGTRKLTLTSEQSSEDVKLSLKEIQGVQVSFNADPYAEVTVPGVIANVETPFSRTLPAGDYTVTFRHGATGKTASARLKGTNGGAFLCGADMSVADASTPASASCRSR